VESSCKLGNEPSGSIKCWELPNGCTTCGLSSSTQLHRVSLYMRILLLVEIFDIHAFCCSIYQTLQSLGKENIRYFMSSAFHGP
jgi:hypothetical protein